MSQGPADSADLGALADLAPELAATFAAIASDIALVIGADGVIRNVAQGAAQLSRQAGDWVGRRFADTVTADTRGKIQLLMQEVKSDGVARRREVNLPGAEGVDIPVAFAAIRLGADGPVLAVGRDLRTIAAIQQRFLAAQQELENDYWKQRQAESRYRLLFQVATDAVMVVDAASLAIVEVNRAAAQLLGSTPEALEGQPATVGIEPAWQPAVQELLVTARASGRPAEIRARLARQAANDVLPVDIAATPFRAADHHGSHLLLLVRARAGDQRGSESLRRLADYVEHTPDAVAITDSSGRLQVVNPAFLLLCAVGASEVQVKGLSLADALGDPARRLDALVADVRRNGIASQVRVPLGHGGAVLLEVEISAALLAEGDQECIGFTLRRHATLHQQALQQVGDLAQAIDNLGGQLGRVALPDLMQQATQLAERHLIRGALARAQGQLDVAADWLGITPDSLRLRLARHGLPVAASDRPPPALMN